MLTYPRPHSCVTCLRPDLAAFALLSAEVMRHLLPILLLAAGLCLILTALASARPAPAADERARTVCAQAEAQVQATAPASQAQCWKKVGLGKVLPSCPAERAILTEAGAAMPEPGARPCAETGAVPLLFSHSGFDPPPPRA